MVQITDGTDGTDGGPDVPPESGGRSAALLDELEHLEAERIRVEARISAVMVHVDDARRAEASRLEYASAREMEAASASDDMSLRLGLTPGAVQARLDELRFVRRQMPQLWAAHVAGIADAYRLKLIVEMAELLEDPDHVDQLDDKLSRWLRSGPRTPGQLRAWLRRFIARAEPEQLRARRRRAWQERSVLIRHSYDGTAALHATVGDTDGVAIQDLIDQLARKRAQDTPGLTARQACADVLADILLGRMRLDGSSTDTTRVIARIGVIVPVTSMAGLSEAPGHTIDRQVALPAHTIRQIAALPGAMFHRLLTDPSDNLLEVTAHTYRAPDRSRRALAFRDGTCVFPTCEKPVAECDLDHIEPWPDGPTAAPNLQHLCRRHHRLKSHGLLPNPRAGPAP